MDSPKLNIKCSKGNLHSHIRKLLASGVGYPLTTDCGAGMGLEALGAFFYLDSIIPTNPESKTLISTNFRLIQYFSTCHFWNIFSKSRDNLFKYFD